MNILIVMPCISKSAQAIKLLLLIILKYFFCSENPAHILEYFSLKNSLNFRYLFKDMLTESQKYILLIFFIQHTNIQYSKIS